MRLAEIALLAVVLLGAVRPMTAWRRSPGLAMALALAIVLTAGLHTVLDGARWQLVPAYVAAVATAALAVIDARGRTGPARRRAPAVVALVLVLIAGALGWALPVTRLAEPPGSYDVGTTELVVTDGRREEQFGPKPGGPRRLPVQLWYPVAPGTTSGHAPWTTQPGAFARAAADRFDLPAFLLSHLRLVGSHAYLDAPIAAGRSRPLVIYSHGWGSFRTAQSTLMESLASRGFVVAAVDHTYASLASVFPDGEVAPLDPAALPEDAPEEDYALASERLVDTFASDIEAVVEHLIDTRPLGSGPDTTNIGILGHSTGGAGAILACGRLAACGAVVGYDPWVVPLPDSRIGEGLAQPLLSLRSEEWVALDNDTHLRRLHAASSPENGLVTIAGAVHRDFTLAPLLSPLAWGAPLGGGTDPRRTHRVVDDWTVRFLDHHLRSAGADPLVASPRHPEATLEH